MQIKDTNLPTKILGVTLIAFEGDIVRDEEGRIMNKVVQVMHHAPADRQSDGVPVMDAAEVTEKVISGSIGSTGE